ncbi:MAG: hypothetical protein QOI31_1724 [Solirubrobacterales bacterium]|nr:hypothetical protein [Solirubrobacterales bacterium]
MAQDPYVHIRTALEKLKSLNRVLIETEGRRGSGDIGPRDPNLKDFHAERLDDAQMLRWSGRLEGQRYEWTAAVADSGEIRVSWCQLTPGRVEGVIVSGECVARLGQAEAAALASWELD